jgi:hypothetical protein
LAHVPLFRTLIKTDLLILDDWGPDRLTASQRRDLMEIIEDRYGRGSTLITSQLPVEAWHEVIAEPTFADAILDRIVHNAYRLALEGPSMRKPEAEAAVSTSDTSSGASASPAECSIRCKPKNGFSLRRPRRGTCKQSSRRRCRSMGTRYDDPIPCSAAWRECRTRL